MDAEERRVEKRRGREWMDGRRVERRRRAEPRISGSSPFHFLDDLALLKSVIGSFSPTLSSFLCVCLCVSVREQ